MLQHVRPGRASHHPRQGVFGVTDHSCCGSQTRSGMWFLMVCWRQSLHQIILHKCNDWQPRRIPVAICSQASPRQAPSGLAATNEGPGPYHLPIMEPVKWGQLGRGWARQGPTGGSKLGKRQLPTAWSGGSGKGLGQNLATGRVHRSKARPLIRGRVGSPHPRLNSGSLGGSTLAQLDQAGHFTLRAILQDPERAC